MSDQPKPRSSPHDDPHNYPRNSLCSPPHNSLRNPPHTSLRSPPRRKARYFERPDQCEQPLTLRETLLVVLSAHLGVRTKAQREQDFRRANGLHLFVAAISYFLLVISGLIFLVKYITS